MNLVFIWSYLVGSHVCVEQRSEFGCLDCLCNSAAVSEVDVGDERDSWRETETRVMMMMVMMVMMVMMTMIMMNDDE